MDRAKNTNSLLLWKSNNICITNSHKKYGNESID